MTNPRAGFNRTHRESMKSAMAESKRRHEEAMRPLLSGNGQMIKKMHKSSRELFDALKVGDSIECFGIEGKVVKKNAKSIVTGLGSRYTLKELGIE